MKNLILLIAGILIETSVFFATTNSLNYKEISLGVLQDPKSKKQTDEYKIYRLEQEKKIVENDKLIKELKTKKNEVKKEKLINYENKIKELEKKNNELRKKIVVNYKDEGVNKWESFKKEFNHDIDELGQSLKNLFKDNVKE
jgi:hypothetical protein